jgi:hypothetical protein
VPDAHSSLKLVKHIPAMIKAHDLHSIEHTCSFDRSFRNGVVIFPASLKGLKHFANRPFGHWFRRDTFPGTASCCSFRPPLLVSLPKGYQALNAHD